MEISTVLPILSVVIAIISVLLTVKKNNSNDGYFVGKVETKLEIIEKKLDDLCNKHDAIHDEINSKIDDRLEHHIKEYHS